VPLETHYLEYFHLNKDVFSSDVVVPFLNLGGRKDLLENIHQTLVFAELPVLIQAEKGLGKTVIARELEKRFSDEFLLLSFDIDELTDENLDDLPARIISQFQAVEAEHESDKIKVVIIDEAHFLTDQLLEQLINLAEHNIRTVFFSEEDLSNAAGDSWYRSTLSPLSLRDAFSLISYLFKQGGVTEIQVPPTAFRELHAESDGKPDELIRLTRAYLVKESEQATAALEGNDGQSNNKLRWVIWGAIAVLLIIVSFVYQMIGQSTGETKSKWVAEKQNVPIDVVATALPVIDNIADRKIEETNGSISQSSIFTPSITSLVTQVVDVTNDTPMDSDNTDVSLSDRLQLAIDKQRNERSLTANIDTPTNAPEMIATITATAVPTVSATRIPTAAPVVASATKSPILVTQTPTKEVVKTDTVVDVVKVVAPTAKPSVSDASIMNDDSWFAKANESAYVVQLFGAWDRESTEKAIKGFKLKADVQIAVTERNGKAWFVAIMGPYENKAKASSATKTLPRQVRKGGPWVRSIASLR
jgi:septal ring-binding cell division protein DamX